MKKCVVIVPIYKDVLSSDDISSIINSKNILSKHDIKFVCSEKLNTKNYTDIVDFEFVRMEDKYFQDVLSYSKLLLNKDFYKEFEEYDYMLICQPDAWVFEDRLEEWCNKGYDYIGAPWFKGYGKAADNAKIFEYAGNGGFSLRNIHTFIDVLSHAENSNKRLKNIFQIYTKEGHISALNILKIPKAIIRYFSKYNILRIAIKESNIPEDNIIVNNLRRLYPYLKVAKAKEAKYFAFEVNSTRLYKECGNKLPFGCHGFRRYDWDFWKEHIKLSWIENKGQSK